MLFLGLVANVNCKEEEVTVNKRTKNNTNANDEPGKKGKNNIIENQGEDEEEGKKLGVNVDVDVDVNSEAQMSDQGVEIEIKNTDKTNIDQEALLALNIDENYQKYYKLWECRKANIIKSYFLNKSPQRIDDEGTKTERKRVCELFSIRSIKDEKAKVSELFYAHYEEDFCEKKLTSLLETTTSEEEKAGGFECEHFEDLSFLFK